VTFHFKPTRASWLSQVECWYSILQGQSLNGASFTSVQQVMAHIDAFIKNHMKTPNRSCGPGQKSTNAA
jgi:hypothetical protein